MVIRHKVLLYILILPVFLFSCAPESTFLENTPKAENGVIDLSNWDFETDGIISLDGEWAFHWKELVYPSEFWNKRFRDRHDYVKVPDTWTKYTIGGQSLPYEGYGTYHLTVKVNPKYKYLALRLTEAATAYTLYVDGEPILESGTLGEAKWQSIPYWIPQTNSFDLESSQFEILVQVSNFHHRFSGLRYPVFIGTKEAIFLSQKLKVIVEMFMFSVLFLMGIYHLVIFFYRNVDRTALYFGLICSAMALRIILTGDRLFLMMVPLPFVISLKMDYITSMVALGLVPLFLNELLFGENKKKFPRINVLVSITYMVVITVLPVDASSFVIVTYQALMPIILIYNIYIVISAIIKGRKAGLIILSGYIFATVAAIHDLLYYNNIILLPIELLPFGLMVLLFTHILVLTKRFSKAFTIIETLSNELEDKNKRLANLDAIKDEFLENTTHELKTPLNGIIGLAESLIDGATGELGSKVKNNLQLIVSSGKRLDNLVNDILDISKLRNNELEIVSLPIDLKVLTDLVIALTTPMVQGKPIKLINDIPPTFPCAQGDENRLQQIMMNLVGNAIKFTNRGYITVNAEKNASMIRVSVSDTGIGIPEVKQKSVFKTFYHLDPADRNRPGTGIGLSISKQLVELHGGTMQLESKPGKGSVFSFTLPMSKESRHESNTLKRAHKFLLQDQIAQSSQGQLLEKKPAMTNRKTILIVDDEPINQQVLKNHLEKEHYRIIQASDGVEALNLIDRGLQPDVMLLDIMMPRMNGYEICTILRENYSAMEMPIIMLTTNNLVSDMVRCFESGANDYISKPVIKEELLARVKQVLVSKHVYDENKVLNLNLEKKVEERTREIETKTEELGEISSHVLAGLSYAGVIQKAVLPHEETYSKFLSQSFVLWKPRDIVSGDFYWFLELEDAFLIALIDCTGHGVPAALLTMTANTLLTRITSDFSVSDPADILGLLNMFVKHTFSRHNEKPLHNEGMDVGICYCNPGERQFIFSGAQIGLYYTSHGEVHYLKGDRQSIGYKRSTEEYEYSNHTMLYNEDMTFYMCTDGYFTQLHNKRNITFGRKKLLNLIQKHNNKPLEEQHRIYERTFNDFKGERPQVDDVSMIGFKIK